MKNVKWLRSIDVVNYDFKGYWQDQGWSDSAIVNTNTRIDVPGRSVKWTGGAITLAGIAFAGARGINSVELSFDNGKTWNGAKLESPPGPLTWRRWEYQWTPSGVGNYTLAARATDGKSDVQTPVPRQPFPDGATGYHVIRIDVTR